MPHQRGRRKIPMWRGRVEALSFHRCRLAVSRRKDHKLSLLLRPEPKTIYSAAARSISFLSLPSHCTSTDGLYYLRFDLIVFLARNPTRELHGVAQNCNLKLISQLSRTWKVHKCELNVLYVVVLKTEAPTATDLEVKVPANRRRLDTDRERTSILIHQWRYQPGRRPQATQLFITAIALRRFKGRMENEGLG